MLQIQFPAAVLSARLIFFQPQNGGEEGVVWQKEYEQRVGLKARTAAALVAGWNEGLRRLVSKAVGDYRRAVPDARGERAEGRLEKRLSRSGDELVQPEAGPAAKEELTLFTRRSGSRGVAADRVRRRSASFQVPRQGGNRATKRDGLFLFFSSRLKRATKAGAIVVEPELYQDLALVWKQGIC
jgi:hypothetical protein